MISVVRELPPSDSCRILVSLESLYGMCEDFPSVRELHAKMDSKNSKAGRHWQFGWRVFRVRVPIYRVSQQESQEFQQIH